MPQLFCNLHDAMAHVLNVMDGGAPPPPTATDHNHNEYVFDVPDNVVYLWE